MRTILLFLMLAGLMRPDCHSAESVSKEKPGIRQIQLVTDISAVTPGEKFTVALVIDPLPGYHTYWRGPGIVGVATRFDWNLPRGFTVGDLSWPPPKKVDMGGILAYGYPTRTMLLTEIQAPERLKRKEVTLRVKCAWMACSETCNPGVDNFSITLPVNRTGKLAEKEESLSAAFEQVRQAIPLPAPSSWRLTPRLTSPNRIELDVSIPGLSNAAAASVYFFCYDMQVDSNVAQQVTVSDDDGKGHFRLILARPNVYPDSPAALSGVLYCPDGWPGLNSPYVEISAPWPVATFKK